MIVVDAWEHAARQFEPPPPPTDPATWAKDRLNEYWWGQQREIAQSVQANRYTAVQSCHDAGKSFIASRAVSWWMDTYHFDDAFVVTTAPTAAQVSAILWREISKAHRKGSLAGRITTAGYPQWKIDGELVGYGRKPADYDDSAFQGIHARHVLIVVDEACGVARSLFDAVDALATNENARVLAIGNPDDPGSHFATICKPGSGWNVIRIDGLRTPNMTKQLVEARDDTGRPKFPLLKQLMHEEQIPYNTEPVPERLRDMLISPLWIEERLQRWVAKGTGPLTERSAASSLFTAKVRGLFPESGTEGVIPLGWVERAIDRFNDWVAAGRPPIHGRKVISADVARSGDDQTAIGIRVGDALLEIRKYQHADTMETTGYITALMNEEVDPHVKSIVDVIGIGAGVVDRLREMGRPVIPFNASAGAKYTDGKPMMDASGEFRFRNLRSAAWWHLREMLDPSRGATIMLPDDDELRLDLTTPKWKLHSGGIIQVEAKDDIKKRLGRSTDSGDTAVQAFFTTAGPGGMDTSEDSAVSWWAETGVDDEEAIGWGV